jgi:hypothetical protein
MTPDEEYEKKLPFKAAGGWNFLRSNNVNIPAIDT